MDLPLASGFRRLPLYAAALVLSCTSAQGQTVYNVPPDAPPASIRAGDLLHVGSGGVVGDNFVANTGSTVHVNGGTIGRGLQATGAAVTIDGGSVGSNFTAFSGTAVTLNGGSVGEYGGLLTKFTVSTGASAVVNGGSIKELAQLQSGTVLTINGGLTEVIDTFSSAQVVQNGGTIGQQLRLRSNATADIHGGSFYQLNTTSTSRATLHGYDFRCNGVPVTGLANIGDTRTFDLPDQGVLSGILSDGTPFAIYDPDAIYLANNSLRLKLTAPAPAGPATINSPTDPVPLGIRSGQTLVLHDGGTIGPYFNAGQRSTLIIEGGDVGKGLEAFGANVVVNGGVIASQLTPLLGSNVTINDGAVTDVKPYEGSQLKIMGGAVGAVESRSGSVAAVRGGVIGDFRALSGSSVTLHGTDFRINGTPIGGLANVGDEIQYDVPSGAVISAVLEDGTPAAFIRRPGSFNPFDAGTLRLKLAADPPPVPVLVQAPSEPVPNGLRPGQTLILGSGAATVANFTALETSTLVVDGGTIGRNFKALGSSITINSGLVSGILSAMHGTSVTVNGGTIGSYLRAATGSTAIINDGIIEGFSAESGATTTINGGHIGGITSISGNASINGGTINRLSAGNVNITVRGGNFLNGFAITGTADLHGGAYGYQTAFGSGSDITLHGADFRINGAPVAGLDNVGDTVLVNVPALALLSGTFADGTPFAFTTADYDTLPSGGLTLKRARVAPLGAPQIMLPGDPAPLGIRAGQTLVLTGGGALPENFNAASGSTVLIHGGTVGDNFEAVGATVKITGGTFAGEFDAFQGSVVELYGGNFRLNGQPITGLSQPGDSVTITQRNKSILTGTLLDGSPFSFDLCAAGNSCYSDQGTGFDFFDTNATLRLTIPRVGDYDLDGDIDAADHSAWSLSFATTGYSPADGNRNGAIDAADYAIWRKHIAGGAGQGAALGPANTPEPATITLATLAAGFLAATGGLRSGRAAAPIATPRTARLASRSRSLRSAAVD